MGNLDIISKCPIFKGLTTYEIKKELDATNAKIVTLKKGDTLFKQGDIPSHMYLLLNGAISIWRDTYSGKRRIIRSFENVGELFMEMYLFLDDAFYDYFGSALKDDTVVLKIPKIMFSSVIKNHDILNKNVLNVLASRAYDFNTKLRLLSEPTLRHKIARVLLLHRKSPIDKNIILPYSREELADYLNVARPSLSRELMKMQEDGLIKIDKNIFIIYDIDELEDFCDL